MVIRRLGRTNESFFTRDEIRKAKSLVETLKSAAASGDTQHESSVASAH
jgi:DNA primase